MRWKNYLAAVFRLLKSDQLSVLATAVAAGCGLAFGLSVGLTTVGFSWPVSLGLMLSAALGVDAGWRMIGRVSPRAGMLARVAFVAWVFAAPMMAGTALTWFGTTAGQLVTTNQGAFAAGALIGVLVVGLPSFLAICALSAGTRSRPSLSTFGFAFGIAGAPLVPIALGGAQLIALYAVVVVALLETLRIAFGSEETESIETPPVPASSGFGIALAYAAIALCGASVSVVARVMNQTMPATAQVLMWSVALLALSVTLGLRTRTTTSGRFAFVRSFFAKLCRQPVALALAAIAVTSVFLLFPNVVRVQLGLNANVAYPRFLLSVRGLSVGLFLFPIGLAAGASLRNVRGSQTPVASPTVVFALGAMAATMLMPLLGTPTIAMGLVSLLAVACLLSTKSSEGRWIPTTVWSRGAAVCALGAAVCLPLVAGRFEPASASQLLFSSTVFREYAAGTDAELLLSTNDGRLLSAEETPEGLLSTWRFAGSRIQVRRNGLPVSLTSTDVLTCPQPSMATLPIMLPLLMHESPEHVLFLGDSGPAAEATSLMFPIQSLTAIDIGQRTSDTIDQHYGFRKQDDRYNHIHASPAIAVTGLTQQYDIIVCRPPQAALPNAAPYYTTDFHQRAARCLSADGFFCQTFNQIDFGAQPLQRLLKSVSSAFDKVAAYPLEGGELLVVATNGETIIRPGLAKRTSYTHVRRILDDLGWDWSRVLGIATLDSESVDAILSTYNDDNSLANAAFLWNLPVETMRWGDKNAEFRMQIAGYQRRILDQLAQDEHRDEAARRLSELGQEAELLFGFPDEPWMYRKTLRTRLENNSRPPQEIVSGNRVKRVAHEVDTYRINYFKTLANATQSVRRGSMAWDVATYPLTPKDVVWAEMLRLVSADSTTSIQQLEQFTSPTEPLLSYFASHELVRIHEAIGGSPAEEFKHRLHTIYFVPGMTRSVREVVAAMNLLVENPEIIPDPADRWDQMNSLLQVLMGRWVARRDIPPRSSRVALNDIEKTLQAIEAGLAAMNDWRVDASIDARICDNREVFLRRRLERPLRRYRGELLPHHYKAGSEASEEDIAVDQFRALGN